MPASFRIVIPAKAGIYAKQFKLSLRLGMELAYAALRVSLRWYDEKCGLDGLGGLCYRFRNKMEI